MGGWSTCWWKIVIEEQKPQWFVSIVVWYLLFCAVASYISTTTFLILHLPLLKFHSHVARENFQHTGFLASKDKNRVYRMQRNLYFIHWHSASNTNCAFLMESTTL